jgi:hypothetical protein
MFMILPRLHNKLLVHVLLFLFELIELALRHFFKPPTFSTSHYIGPGIMGSINQEYTTTQISLGDAVGLLSGQDFWRTRKNESLGLGSLKFSDGPNGVRGEDWINGAPSAAIPCATALGASFDVELVSQLAGLLAKECERKGVHGLLAPTMNIHRYPLCKSCALLSWSTN